MKIKNLRVAAILEDGGTSKESKSQSDTPGNPQSSTIFDREHLSMVGQLPMTRVFTNDHMSHTNLNSGHLKINYHT